MWIAVLELHDLDNTGFNDGIQHYLNQLDVQNGSFTEYPQFGLTRARMVDWQWRRSNPDYWNPLVHSSKLFEQHHIAIYDRFFQTLKVCEESADFRAPPISNNPEHVVLEDALAMFCVKYLTTRDLLFRRLVSLMKNKHNVKTWRKTKLAELAAQNHAAMIHMDVDDPVDVEPVDDVDPAEDNHVLGVENGDKTEVLAEEIEDDHEVMEEIQIQEMEAKLPSIGSGVIIDEDAIHVDLTDEDRVAIRNYPSRVDGSVVGFVQQVPMLVSEREKQRNTSRSGRHIAVPSKFDLFEHH